MGEQVRNVAKILSGSRHCFSLFSLYFQFWRLFQKSLSTLLWQITVFWRLSTTNSNTLFPGAENFHEVKTDLHLRRSEFLRLPAGFPNLFSWQKLEGLLIISWNFQDRTPQEIWITAIFPAQSRLVSYDVLHHTCIVLEGHAWVQRTTCV